MNIDDLTPGSIIVYDDDDGEVGVPMFVVSVSECLNWTASRFVKIVVVHEFGIKHYIYDRYVIDNLTRKLT
jgi:hypothetical protein